MIHSYDEKLSAPHPTLKLEYQHCLFKIFGATHPIGGCSSIRNLRTSHAVVTGTHLSWAYFLFLTKKDVHEIAILFHLFKIT
jgi:hypothetical protein